MYAASFPDLRDLADENQIKFAAAQLLNGTTLNLAQPFEDHRRTFLRRLAQMEGL
jgi:hypothetical protein